MLGLAQSVLITLASFLFVLTLVIVVHEMGHFLAAKLFRVSIDRFSVGFGKTLFARRDKSGVEWRIAALPLGGYVRFKGDENAASVPDQNDLDAMREWIEWEEGKDAVKRYFHFKPLWQRAIVVAAGPIANFVLATVLFGLLLTTIGELTTAPRVYAVSVNSPAERAGFQVGDVVKKADTKAISSAEDLARYVTLRADVPIRFEVERGGHSELLTATPAPTLIDDAVAGSQKIGTLGIESIPAKVGAVIDGGGAAKAGLMTGDVIVGADGQRIGSFNDLLNYVEGRPNTVINFELLRAGQPVRLAISSGSRELKASNGEIRRVGMIGVRPAFEIVEQRLRVPLHQALGAGAQRTWDVLETTVYYLSRLVKGQVSADQLGGPLGIARVSGAVTEAATAGAPDWPSMILGTVVGLLGLTAVLSVSIGFMNLLPVPVLDGGHLLFYAYEAVARRPLAARVQAAGYRVGLALLLGFMLFATWNDLQRMRVFHFLGGLFS